MPQQEMPQQEIPQREIGYFQKDLFELYKDMNEIEAGKFLSVSATRYIVYQNAFFSKNTNSKTYSRLLNAWLITLGFSCILLFNKDKRALNNPRFFPGGKFIVERALSYAFDFALGRNTNAAPAHFHFYNSERDCVYELTRDSNDIKFIMIKDAENILSGNDMFSCNTAFLQKYEDDFSGFLAELRNLNGHYWAEWFEGLFKNNFHLDNKDIEAFLSLERNQYEVSIEETSAYLIEYIKGSTDSNEIRLMILGNKGEGKTSFARRFHDLTADMPKETESTDGIDVHEFMYSKISKDITAKEIYKETERDVTIKIWDFAGHEVTHAAHKFFLSEKCVYVIVCQARQGESDINSKIEYWLEHIRDYARGVKNGEAKKIFILIKEKILKVI